ncbi:tRNA (N6-isopentenyl adenosine(37)-C2)-methylthiotransferase MiaB [Patescibacteria group bacterium]|nr:tRNA (N6-isopentenyl adenosine(37)-C2)-methylthiotransferase MiaB [Patescibacteria group bacterium]
MKSHRYHIITFGCQMNKSDSERIESVLRGMGMEVVDRPEEADVIVMNTCSVRKSAEDRVYGLSYNFSKLKKQKPDLVVCITGCMPGRDKDGKLKKKLKEVDFYFPIKDVGKLPGWLHVKAASGPRATEEREAGGSVTQPHPLSPSPYKGEGGRAETVGSEYLSLTPVYKNKFQAFVTIQTGCNHFCTYCVVPFARGTEGNRSLKEILDEVHNLAAQGCKEATLLGQIVNHYIAPDPEYFSESNPYKKNDFAKLLWEINQIPGIRRIHWTGPHPIYMDDEMIDALTLPSQINFLHLPVQSGNTEILQKMNRRHDREFFLDLIKKIKNKRPGIALGTDIIVGFCGEKEAQFEDTISMYKICDFDIAYPAKYSTRPGTIAAKKFVDDVPWQEKKRRWQAVQDLMEEITWRKNQAYIGKKVSVLVENWQDGYCTGNSSELKLVEFLGKGDLVGTIQEIEIDKAEEWILRGRPVT